MAVSKKIIELTRLALEDRMLTFKEREVIVKNAVAEGVLETEINAFLDNMLAQRLKTFTKEELKRCPSCHMFFAAILLRYNPKPESKFSVKSLRQSLTSMEEYPDVKKYAEDVDAELDCVENEKKSYKRKMNIIFYSYVAVLVGFLVHTFVTDSTYLRDDLENIHQDDNCGKFAKAAEYFNLQPKTPFAVIRPFDSEQTPSDIQLFIVNINTSKGYQAGDCLVAFRFTTPEIKNSNKGDNYTITITDMQGPIITPVN